MSKKANIDDLIDQKIGKLKVIKYDHPGTRFRHYYLCKCDCGNMCIKERSALKRGIKHGILSCRCFKYDHPKIDPNDIVGRKFGRLKVLHHAYIHKDRKSQRHIYDCHCDCGNDTFVDRASLLKGKTLSCGCLNKEIISKHNMSDTKFYNTYTAMKYRCTVPTNHAYSDYGGRGIKVCDRWLGEDGFIHFKEDMYESYLKRAEECGGEQYISIDRINVNGDYEPSNCRWATRKEQMNNTRRNNRVLFEGKSFTLREIYELIGDSPVSYDTFHGRYVQLGWNLF